MARVHRYHLPAWLSARKRCCAQQRVQKAGCGFDFGERQGKELESEEEGEAREEERRVGMQDGVEAGRRGSSDGGGGSCRGGGVPATPAGGCLATAEDWAEVVQVRRAAVSQQATNPIYYITGIR